MIRLLTFVWYTPQKCNASQLIEVNRFDKSSKRWQHENFKIEKFSHFHGCRLGFMINSRMPEFYHTKVDQKRKSIVGCIGYHCGIVINFGKALNYTIQMNTYRGQKQLFYKMPFDLCLLSSSLEMRVRFDGNNQYVVTRPIYHDEHFLTLTPGEEFNGYEKLYLPFDEPTWAWIGITFTTAFVTIFVLRFVRKDIALFVIGRGVTTPTLNVFRGFFGIGQIVCPGRNFARYNLVMFILFSLVIRTAYQGKMFEFLQKEMRKPAPESIDEMIDQNYTFYMTDLFSDKFPDLDFTKR